MFSWEPIPSREAAEGLAPLRRALPELITAREPAADELKRLHLLATEDVPLSEPPPQFRRDVEVSLMLDGRTDAAEITEQIRGALREGRIPFAAQQVTERRLSSLSNTVTELNIDPRRGHLRQFGTRQIGNGSLETIFADTSVVIDEGKEFLNLTAGLDGVYTLLCDKYDELRQAAEANPLDAQLRTLAFMQLWGIVLHPFWDANGRALTSHLIVELNRKGLRTEKPPSLGEIHSSMEKSIFHNVSHFFRLAFMRENDIPIFSSSSVAHFKLDPTARQQYMAKLKRALEKGIGLGLDTESPYYGLIDGAAYLIQLWLSKEGLVDRQLYEEQAPGLKAQMGGG